MTGFQRPSNIQNLNDLSAAKKVAQQEIEQSFQRLEASFSALPARLMGGTVTLVASAVVKGIYTHLLNKEEKEVPSTNEPTPEEPENFGQTLKTVGEETAWFALSKLVEKLLAKH